MGKILHAMNACQRVEKYGPMLPMEQDLLSPFLQTPAPFHKDKPYTQDHKFLVGSRSKSLILPRVYQTLPRPVPLVLATVDPPRLAFPVATAAAAFLASVALFRKALLATEEDKPSSSTREPESASRI